jgi:hypothetical protein
MSTPTGGGLSVAWVPERTVITPSSDRRRSLSWAAAWSAAPEAGFPSMTASIFKAISLPMVLGY